MGKHRQQDELSQDQSEQQNQQQKAEIRRPKIERIDKFKSLKKIVINISMTQYPVVAQVSEDLNWKIQNSNDAGDWDVYWTDFAIDPDILIKMHLFQKINHFPGMHVIARKNLLGMNLMALRNKLPDQYNFFPLTWMLPMQYAEFRAYYETKPKGKARTYIAKPEAQCQGRGIFLTRRIQDLQNGKHYVVQRYLARPFLLEGLKFDLRIYVLLCGTNPLRLYMYKQGLARLATEPYSQPNTFNLERQYIHLTNYAINKNNPKFIFNNNSNNMGIGHKRSITCVFKQLATMGVNIEELKQKINDVAIKTLICGIPHMSHQYKCSQPEDYSGNMCFHILGLDIMLNSKGQPILLQVNHTPSFTTDTPLDHKIKFNLIKDTLVLMNINVKSKNQLYNKAKQINKERLITGKRQIYQGQQRQKAISEAQALRDQYQDKNLGGFQRIFPLRDQQKMRKYNNIIETANKIYVQENTSLRVKQLEKQSKRLQKPQNKISQRKLNIQSTKIQQSPIININPQSSINIQLQQSKILNSQVDQFYQQANKMNQMEELTKSQNIQRQNIVQNNSEYIATHLIKRYTQKNKQINEAMARIEKKQARQASENGNRLLDMKKSNSINKVAIKKELVDRVQYSQNMSKYQQRMKSITVGQRYSKKSNIPSNLKNFPNLAEQITNVNFSNQTNNSLHHDQNKKVIRQSTKRNYTQNKNRTNKIYECVARQTQYNMDKKASSTTNGNFIMPKIININLDNQIKYFEPPNSFQPFRKVNAHPNQ